MDTLMDNATQQILAELLKICLSVVGLIVAYYTNRWLSTNATAKKYELDKVFTEDTINNAILYAENIGIKQGLKGIEKKQVANRYLDVIDPKLVKKLGVRLDLIMDTQVAKKLKNIG